ncbi:unnamed protein product [Sphagnum balticum]
MGKLMQDIIHGADELRRIRRDTGMETVPWRIHVKEYEVDGKVGYDLGVTSVEAGERVVAKNVEFAEAEERRREQIRS